MDTTIQKANDKMEFISIDKDTLRLYRMREMAMSDYTSGMNYAKEQGKIEGKIECARTIAEKMLKRGADLQLIVEDTGLTEDEILELQS